MTSPRGSSAPGRSASGDDGGAVSAPGAGHADVLTAEAPAAEASQRGRAEDESPTYRPGPAWARWLPPAAALLISLWGISTPSYWRDEAATIAAIRRPLGDLIRMLGNVDAVHGAYYLMMWPLEHALGSGALVLRLPSAVAVAVGAAVVAATGRRLISPWAGLAAGLLYAVLPVTSMYGQDVRSYAMVMTVAAIASYLLVRVLQAEPASRRRWLIWYGVSIAALGILNIFGLLLVPAHAVTIAVACRRGLRDSAVRRLAVSWLAAAVAGIAVASPLLVFGWLQRSQIAWLGVNTSSSGLNTLFSLSGSFLVTTTVLAAIAVALVLSTEMSREQRRAVWPWRLAELSLPWLIVPPLVLLVASIAQPVYTSRYILICIPALALVGGAAVASYGRLAGAIALAVILISGADTQVGQRMTGGHYDDILALDHIVAKHARRGDYVLYTNPNAESFGAAYPYGLGKLRNIALKEGPIQSGTLAGTNASVAEIKSRLAHAKRVWVVEINSLSPDPLLLGLNGLPISATPIMDNPAWHFTSYWHERGDYMILYTRT
jgi:mannosyltransferase